MQFSTNIGALLREKTTRQMFAIFLIMLLDLKAILGKNPVWSMLPPILVGLFLLSFAFNNSSKKGFALPQIPYYSSLLLIFIYVSLVCVAVFRTNSFLESAIGGIFFFIKSMIFFFVTLYLFMRVYLHDPNYRNATNRILHTVILVLTTFLAIQVAAGFVLPPTEGELNRGVIASALGLNMLFHSFPLAGGHPNSIGVIGGVLFVISFLTFWYFNRQEQNRILLIASAGIATLVMIIADSRGTILNAALAVGIVIGLDIIKKGHWLLVILWLLPVAQIGMLAGMKAIADSEVGTQLSRGKKDLSTGNSRLYIYQYSFGYLEDFEPKHLVGFGEYGPYAAGFVWKYLDKFDVGAAKLREADIVLLSVSHNAALQVIFDSGYIGLLIFLLILYLGIRDGLWLKQRGIPAGLVFVGFILYYALSGITESTSGRYNEMYHLILIFMLISTALIRNYYKIFAFSEPSDT